MKKILILSVSAGFGHVMAAEALKQTAEAQFGQSVSVDHIDIVPISPFFVSLIYKHGYNFVVDKIPFYWGYMYKRTDRVNKDSILTRLRNYIESVTASNLFKKISEFKPDHILCTHFLPAKICAKWKRKGKIGADVWTAVTDYVPHKFWLDEYQTGFFVANEECVFNMSERNIPKEKITITGIPVRPEFGVTYDRSESAAKFGVSPDKTTVLLMGGASGIGGLFKTSEALLKLSKDFQLIALCGSNGKLLEKLNKLAAEYPEKLYPLPFTKEVYRLLACSDIVISKPGGLTTAECMAMGKPVIVISPIPGQEVCNANIMLESGAAFKAEDLRSLQYRVKYLLDNPEKAASMGENAGKLGKPDAAYKIILKILSA